MFDRLTNDHKLKSSIDFKKIVNLKLFMNFGKLNKTW